jgi:Domain of unknown function (DUF5658)
MAAVGDLQAIEATPGERRYRRERRDRRLWALCYGSFKPRRRAARREVEEHIAFVDWHDAHLLGVALAILLLSSMDAFLTLILLVQGAHEVNPMMAQLLYGDVGTFAAVKMALTGIGVLTLVVLSRCRVFGRIRVDLALYLTLCGYVVLVAYEFSMLSRVA